MFLFYHVQLNVLLLYNENSKKRTLTYWGLIYKNINKEFTKNLEHIKHKLNKD